MNIAFTAALSWSSSIKANHMTNLEIVSLSNRKLLNEFIRLPYILHMHHSGWTPPLHRDERDYLDPGKNPGFRYCDATLALALLDGRPVGRIMGVVNNRYNLSKNVKTARFCLFECINDQETAHMLFEYIGRWAQEKDMTEIIGPFGMYYHDPTGFIVEGMEHPPALSTYVNFDYIPPMVEKEGYTTAKEFRVYRIEVPAEMPPVYQRIEKKIKTNVNLKRINFTSRRQLKPYIMSVVRLLNETYEDIHGYSRLDDVEVENIAGQYLKYLDPALIKAVEYEGELAGFIIAMPNISKGLIAAKGHLFPFGFMHLLLSAKRSEQLDLLLGGIKKKYQGIGIDILLGMELLATARSKKFSIIDSHLELETNFKIHAEMEKVGGKVYKKYRLYQKSL